MNFKWFKSLVNNYFKWIKRGVKLLCVWMINKLVNVVLENELDWKYVVFIVYGDNVFLIFFIVEFFMKVIN